MKIVIDIPEEVKQTFDNAENNDLKNGYYDHGGVIGNAIRNGTPLPKNHGRLIDADVLEECKGILVMNDREIGYGVFMSDVRNAPTIIEAEGREE